MNPSNHSSWNRQRRDTRSRPACYTPAMPPLGLIALLERIYHNWRNRRRLQSLLNEHAHLLRDIGYTRGQVECLIRQPLTAPPKDARRRCGMAR